MGVTNIIALQPIVIQFLIFLLLSFEHSLYILHTNRLSDL